MEASITFKSVAKKIKDETLLAELTFGVEKNTIFSIVGPNGSGKSTILKLVCGLICKDKGSIYVKGYDLDNKIEEVKSIIGYMPQNNQLDNDLTVLENLSLYAQLSGCNKDKAIKSSQFISDRLRLNKYLNCYPENLSFSILRMISFARSVVHDPEILILDEPTLYLDPINRDLIWSYLNEIKHNKTIFYATQNFYESQEYSNRIAILYDGSIKYNGTFNYLVKNTFGLARFMLSFSNGIPDTIKKSLSLRPNIIKPTMIDNKLKFYSTDKMEFFKILRESIDYDINDIDSSKCTLEDIFKGINPGESE